MIPLGHAALFRWATLDAAQGTARLADLLAEGWVVVGRSPWGSWLMRRDKWLGCEQGGTFHNAL
jgi:hypothetical protein